MASQQVVRITSRMNRFIERLIKKLVLDIVANLQSADDGTPVDTGWARANWVPNIGSPLEGTAGTRAAAEAGNLSGDSESGKAKVAATYRLSMGKIFVSNNTPYILALDGGSSTQTPKGFIRRGIIKAIRVDLVAG